MSSAGPHAGIAFLGGPCASKNAWTIAGLSTLTQGLLRGPRQSEPFSPGIAISSDRLRLMPCRHTFAPRPRQWRQMHVPARRQAMTRTEPLADLHMANQRMNAPAPNTHSRVATLELIVTAPDQWRRRRNGQRNKSWPLSPRWLSPAEGSAYDEAVTRSDCPARAVASILGQSTGGDGNPESAGIRRHSWVR